MIFLSYAQLLFLFSFNFILFFNFTILYWFDFPGGSDGKASVCNVGDLGSIPGLGSSLEKEKATHSSTLA